MSRIVTENGTTASPGRAIALPTTGQRLVDQGFAAIGKLLRTLLEHPRAEQTTVRDQVFAAGVPKVVEHRLGRAYRGCDLVSFRTSGATWLVTPSTDERLNALQVTITASANCTADVEVW